MEKKEEGLFYWMKGYTPCSDWIIKKYGLYASLVFGKIYRYGKCQAKITTIGDDLDISSKTVERAIKTLEEAKLVIDHTPTLRNRPHTYTVDKKETMRQYREYNNPDKEKYVSGDKIRDLIRDLKGGE